jgi:AmmeMemoRadiSam system protein A
VIENARGAAVRDPRFLPLSAREVSSARIEISLLSPPVPVRFSSPDDLLRQLMPHHHGVVLRIGSRSSTYLPKVWEHFPDKVAFLDSLAEKAGCPPGAWRAADVQVSLYTVESFAEPDPAT